VGRSQGHSSIDERDRVGTGNARFGDARFRVRVERAGDAGYAAWRL
jgi:hypothetical protein